MSEFIPLSGCPISEEFAVGQLRGDDSFLISQPTTPENQSEFYQSRRVSYDTVRDDIYGTIFGNLGLGSMATESSSDYAPSTHEHYGRYSVVSVEQFYHRNPNVDESDDVVVVLGHIVVDGTSYDICVPRADSGANSTKIGTLRFVANPNMPQIDESSDDFDGWTYPDGRTLRKAEFPDAYSVFGGTYGETADRFGLPVISDFIELNAFRQPDDSMERRPYNLAVGQHVHQAAQMKISGDFELRGALNNYQVTDPNTYTSYNHGSPQSPDMTISCEVTFGLSAASVLSGESECNLSNDMENHPAYVNIPVLMYIGARRHG